MAATLVEAMSDLTLKEPETKESMMVEFKVCSVLKTLKYRLHHHGGKTEFAL